MATFGYDNISLTFPISFTIVKSFSLPVPDENLWTEKDEKKKKKKIIAADISKLFTYQDEGATTISITTLRTMTLSIIKLLKLHSV